MDGKLQKHRLMLNGEAMKPSPANVRYAHRLAAEIRERIRHGTFSLLEYFPSSGSGATPVMVATQLETWLSTQRVEQSTRAGYVAASNFWVKAIGARVLRALKHSEVLAALAARPDLSGKTVNNYVSVLRQACALAVVDGLLISNPVEGVPSAAWQRDPPDPFTRDEASAIIAAMPAGQVRNMVEWRFFTGVRTSEMAGLHWGSVDLASGYVQVHEAMVRGVAKSKTKTGVARDVILNSRALAALTRQKAHTYLAGGHVWMDPRLNRPWEREAAFRRIYWVPALKKLGIRYRRPNNCRHTYATMMLMAGMTPAFCARQLGHGVEVFLRTYSKWLNGGQNALEMARLEAAIADRADSGT